MYCSKNNFNKTGLKHLHHYLGIEFDLDDMSNITDLDTNKKISDIKKLIKNINAKKLKGDRENYHFQIPIYVQIYTYFTGPLKYK